MKGVAQEDMFLAGWADDDMLGSDVTANRQVRRAPIASPGGEGIEGQWPVMPCPADRGVWGRQFRVDERDRGPNGRILLGGAARA